MATKTKSQLEEVRLHEQESALASAMVLAQQGDSAAYLKLLEAIEVLLKVYVMQALRRMGFQDAGLSEDVVQDILLAVHNKRHTYDPKQLFTPWLFAIARYKVIDFGRRQKRYSKNANIENFEDVLEAPIFDEPTSNSDLKTLIETLPEKSRKLLELVKIEGLSIAEAAAQTQMSESAVKVSIHRAIKTLQEKLMGKS